MDNYYYLGFLILMFAFYMVFLRKVPKVKQEEKEDIKIGFKKIDDETSEVIINGEGSGLKMRTFTEEQVDKIEQAKAGLSDEDWKQKKREDKLRKLLE